MQNLNSLSLTHAVNDWLVNTHHPRILHIFDGACNLINEHREVLSIVTPQIGNGPFNLVVGGNVCFAEHLSLQSPVSFSATQLQLGSLTIHITSAKLWNPRPNWEMLHSNKKIILDQLTELPITNYQLPGGFDTPLEDHSGLLNHQHLPITQFLILQSSNSLLSTLVAANLPSSLTAAQKLAGLGIGLTPSGDDFIMGALYASWITHPLEISSALAKEIAEAAAPVTTSLSGAWLKSAGRGEAGILWHNLFNSLILPAPNLESPVSQILSTGETSGADALAGFFGMMSAFQELIIDKCPF